MPEAYNPETLKTIGYHQTYDTASEDVGALQEGFDEGYRVGIEEGMRVGELLGMVNNASGKESDIALRREVNALTREGLKGLMVDLEGKKDKESVDDEDDRWLREGVAGQAEEKNDDDDWLAESDEEDVKPQAAPDPAPPVEEEQDGKVKSLSKQILDLIKTNSTFTNSNMQM